MSKEFKVNVYPDSLPCKAPAELPSVTEPGMSETVSQILDRYMVSGQVIAERRNGGFTSTIEENDDVRSQSVQDAFDTPDYSDLDPLEMADLARDLVNNSSSSVPEDQDDPDNTPAAPEDSAADSQPPDTQ